MKILLMLLISNSLFASTSTGPLLACPKDVESKLSKCLDIKCSRDDSEMLNRVFKSKEKFVTNITVKKNKKDCNVKYLSEWTGTQVCNFPLEHLEAIISIMGDSSTSEGLEMFVAMEKLSESKNKEEFNQHNNQLNSLRNKMMSKELEARKFIDQNPKIAKQLNSFCKLDKKQGTKNKVTKYENYMKELNERMMKIESAAQSKIQKFSN